MIARLGRIRCLVLLGAAFWSTASWADPPASTESALGTAKEEQLPVGTAKEDAINTDLDTNENPEAARKADRRLEPPKDKDAWSLDFYGSARIHAINNWDFDTEQFKSKFGDGASRIGVAGEWTFAEGWDLFGRLEAGFDVLDTFTSKGQTDSDRALTGRFAQHRPGV